MWDVRVVRLLQAQSDLVAWWQLRDSGWTRRMIEHHSWNAGWRPIHRGVWATHHGPITRRHLWIAATLTAPGSVLFGRSACACHGFIEWDGPYETVVRPGSGGPRRYPGLVASRSMKLDGATTRVDEIPVLRAQFALISVANQIPHWQLARGFRESIRLKTTTANELARALKGQRGTKRLRALCDRYATIPYHRCRSDAESRALEILHDAEVEPPLVNVRVAGPRPDFTWRRHRLIIEIDGPQFHLFADEDARKQAIWEGAGYTVRRVPSDDVYFRPERLLALAPPNVPHAPR